MKDKRTYEKLKDHSNDISYENEFKHSVEDRGSGDLTYKIEMLTQQKKYLQKQCRKAGHAILDLEVTNSGLKKEIDRLSEENDNLITMLGEKNAKR